MASIEIQNAELKKSAVQYQKELLIMPVIAAQETLKHMTGRPGMNGRVVLSELTGSLQLAPYNAKRKEASNLKIHPRELEVFLGSAQMEFDPNELHNTVWGSLITQGEGLKNVDINKKVLEVLAASMGKALGQSIWTAKRAESGTTTKELFNGFDTITDTEIAAGNIAKGKNNEHDFSAAITSANAVDFLKEFYFSASDELKTQKVKMYMPVDVYNAYCEDYKTTTGAIAYNTQYEKTFLEGSQNLCELVPLASKKGSKYIHLAPQTNLVYGYGNGIDGKEIIGVDKFEAFVLTFYATMYFGCQFRSINPEMLHVGKFHGNV